LEEVRGEGGEEAKEGDECPASCHSQYGTCMPHVDKRSGSAGETRGKALCRVHLQEQLSAVAAPRQHTDMLLR